jgi:hypothetical protein
VLKLNLKRLVKSVESTNSTIFITSSWYSILTLNEFGEIALKEDILTEPISNKPHNKKA